jgi:putative membrane protein
LQAVAEPCADRREHEAVSDRELQAAARQQRPACLSAAHGVDAVETAPVFFHAISPVLPMTYAVNGFRHLVASGEIGQVWVDATMLATCAGVFLLITVFAVHRNRLWSIERLHPSLAT